MKYIKLLIKMYFIVILLLYIILLCIMILNKYKY